MNHSKVKVKSKGSQDYLLSLWSCMILVMIHKLDHKSWSLGRVGWWRRECPFRLLGVIKGRKSCPAFPPLCLKAERTRPGLRDSGVWWARPARCCVRARARKKWKCPVSFLKVHLSWTKMQSFKIIPGPSDRAINQLFAKSLLDFLSRKMIINRAATGGDNDSKPT